MKHLVFCLILITADLFFTSCNIKPEDLVENFSYQYSEAFCETGYHSFNTLNAYCEALRNDVLNNGCARAQRQDAFYNRCSGSF